MRFPYVLLLVFFRVFVSALNLAKNLISYTMIFIAIVEKLQQGYRKRKTRCISETTRLRISEAKALEV